MPESPSIEKGRMEKGATLQKILDDLNTIATDENRFTRRQNTGNHSTLEQTFPKRYRGTTDDLSINLQFRGDSSRNIIGTSKGKAQIIEARAWFRHHQNETALVYSVLEGGNIIKQQAVSKNSPEAATWELREPEDIEIVDDRDTYEQLLENAQENLTDS